MTTNQVDLGRFEFAPVRADLDPDDRLENDTPVEASLLKSIVDWFESGRQPSKGVVDVLRLAMEDDDYSSFFREPDVSVVYRGISLDRETFREVLGHEASEALDVKVGSVDGNWVLTPPDYARFSSFSRSRDVAQRFADDNSYSERPYAVVFHARVSDNPGVFFDFFQASKRLSIDFVGSPEEELEAIGLAPVKVFRISWSTWQRT